jgi:hypothetical protein
MNAKEIEQEIDGLMPLDEFLKIHRRLKDLRFEEEAKLRALSELQQVYLGANTDQERELVKEAVARIRELSRATRQEIRELNNRVVQFMPLEQARELFERYEKSVEPKS